MSAIEAFRNLPELNFIEKDVETILRDMVSGYEEAYFEATGQRITLASGDPRRIWIYSQALKIYGAYQLIDHTAKQNLLRYARGAALDHIAARVGLIRKEATPAIATQKFTLSASQPGATPIPAGTRVTPGNGIFFATTEYEEIPSGETEIEVEVTCLQEGEAGNGFTPGQINTLVDPIPFVAATENTTLSQGGEEEESDDSLRERIFLRPESFSVAGPTGAYEYFTRAYSPSISDVKVDSPAPCEVDVYFILQNGELPDSAMIEAVQEYLSDETRRPLTDKVTVKAPEPELYDIQATYWISTTDQSMAEEIQARVEAAVEEYILWQKQKIGRDINPSKLEFLMMQAGAKRVKIDSPAFTTIDDAKIAFEGLVDVTYGGLEDE